MAAREGLLSEELWEEKDKIKKNWSETYGIREEKYTSCNRRNK